MPVWGVCAPVCARVFVCVCVHVPVLMLTLVCRALPRSGVQVTHHHPERLAPTRVCIC